MAGTTGTSSNAGRLSPQQRQEREQRVAHLQRASNQVVLASPNQVLSKNPTIDELKQRDLLEKQRINELKNDTPPRGQEVNPKPAKEIGTSPLKPK